MEGLLEQLGINWKLFLSQAFNFFILLFVLKIFVYGPLLKIIKKRNERIKEGLDKANEADKRLGEVDIISKGKIKEAEMQSVGIIKETQERAKELENSLKIKAEKHNQELMAQIELSHKRQQDQARQEVLKNASELVKKIIAKTVELEPDNIDEVLIKKAIKHYEI